MTPATTGGPGWQTSEFLLTALLTVGVFVLLALGRIEVKDVGDLWPMFMGGGAYAVARGGAKMKSKPEVAEPVPEPAPPLQEWPPE